MIVCQSGLTDLHVVLSRNPELIEKVCIIITAALGDVFPFSPKEKNKQKAKCSFAFNTSRDIEASEYILTCGARVVLLGGGISHSSGLRGVMDKASLKHITDEKVREAHAPGKS